MNSALLIYSLMSLVFVLSACDGETPERRKKEKTEDHETLKPGNKTKQPQPDQKAFLPPEPGIEKGPDAQDTKVTDEPEADPDPVEGPIEIPVDEPGDEPGDEPVGVTPDPIRDDILVNIADGPTTTSCDGKSLNGGCWYASGQVTSCTETCATHGGYDAQLTRSIGDQGTASQCAAVVSLFTTDIGQYIEVNNSNCAAGCSAHIGAGYYYRCAGSPTTAAATNLPSRMCACKN